MAENVLFHGDVLKAAPADPRVGAIKQYNASRSRDDRVVSCILPLGDGLSVARKC